MKRSTTLLFALLSLLFWSACGSDTEQSNGETTTGSENTASLHDLSIKLEPGASFVWKISWNDETVTQIPDEERGEGWNDVIDATGYTMTIESISDEVTPEGVAKLNSQIMEVSAYYNSEDRNLSYDSNRPETAPQSMGYHHYMNRILKYDLDKTGAITNLEGGKEIYANFGDPDLMNIGNTYTAEILEVYTHLLPGKVVAVGDSWKVSHKYSAGTGIIMDLTLTLNAVAGNIAEIGIANKVRVNPAAIPTLIGETEFSYDLSGNGEGTLNINLDNGLPIHLIHSFHLTGHTLFKVPDQEEPKKYFTTKTFFFEQQSI